MGFRRLGFIALLAFLALPGFTRQLPSAEPERYRNDVAILADPSMEGRGAGTEGLARARDYIAGQFRKVGLEPAGEEGTFLQALTVTTGAELGSENRFAVRHDGKEDALEPGADYLPLSFSSNGTATAPVLFAGYGASADEFSYDDYSHLDVNGKIVIILRYEPPSFNPEKDAQRTHHSHLISKAINARNHGARAVVLVNGLLEKGEEDLLLKFGSVSGPEDAGILIVQAKNEAVDAWLKTAGRSLPDIQREINERSEPRSFALPDSLTLSLEVDIRRKHATVDNIAAYLPGQSEEYVILGAHYDHLGYGDDNSLAPSEIGKVHPGADDNASGTAGILELARIFASRPAPARRGVLFLSFAAEEIGLLGARAWLENPTRPLDKAVAMINLDMIGRIRDNKVYLGGTGTGSNFDSLLDEVKSAHDLHLETSRSGYSASDHTVFVTRNIPVLFFFSGLHGDYHKPSDTWEKINPEPAARLIDLVADLTSRLRDAGRPQFVRVTPETSGHGSPAALGRSGGGYGPYFGSIPDFGEVESGVRFADIRPGSPADKAGLKGGDILIQFGEKPIKNLYDFTYALRASKIGDTVTVKVLRDGKQLTADVTLEQRK